MPQIVNFKFSNFENRRFCLLLQFMPQSGAHSRQQFAHAEWLIDEIIGPKIEGFDFFDLAIAGRQNDYWYIRPFAYVTDDMLAILVRQAQVENDNVRSGISNDFDCVGGGSCSGDFIIIG